MSYTPQVETAEIADSELDNISGGLVNGLVGSVTASLDSVAPVSDTLGTVTGVVEQTTGLNTAPVTGLVAGL
ncbi:type A2 lantipeptide [Streptomyces albidoflavus]|uniref:type A2 lantipeptide n=1 Tax=Streptomyces albidoflavus TaxID=1886 RepID=UPI0033AA372A